MTNESKQRLLTALDRTCIEMYRLINELRDAKLNELHDKVDKLHTELIEKKIHVGMQFNTRGLYEEPKVSNLHPIFDNILNAHLKS